MDINFVAVRSPPEVKFNSLNFMHKNISSRMICVILIFHYTDDFVIWRFPVVKQLSSKRIYIIIVDKTPEQL